MARDLNSSPWSSLMDNEVYTTGRELKVCARLLPSPVSCKIKCCRKFNVQLLLTKGYTNLCKINMLWIVRNRMLD
ncbi:hypothetical protein SDJN03_25384, partial [Cucurbita argyrosperma subsp. sororia]